MEATSSIVTSLAEHLLQLKAKKNNKQVWVSISGAPGSGKSSLADQLTHVLPNAVVIPMDGFHFYKTYLSSMPDPELAFASRGAAWTFDASKFVDTLKTARLRQAGVFPSFDHSVGDPVEEDIAVAATHEFVIVEGLYLLLSSSPWNEIKSIVDISIFVQADPATLRSRLTHRHMSCFHMTKEEAEERADRNDLPNAVDIVNNKNRADLVVENS